MRVTVWAKANAKREYVRSVARLNRRNSMALEVAVHAPPTDGRANAAIVRALAGHLGVSPSRVILVRGAKAKTKIFEIN